MQATFEDDSSLLDIISMSSSPPNRLIQSVTEMYEIFTRTWNNISCRLRCVDSGILICTLNADQAKKGDWGGYNDIKERLEIKTLYI